MRILIISPGYIPVTSKKGAIEKLIEYYLDYNEQIKDDITLYTVKLSDKIKETKSYEHTDYKVIDKSSLQFKLEDIFYRMLNRLTGKTHPNAYIRRVIKDIKKENNINTYDRVIFENSQYFLPFFKTKTKLKNKTILHLHNDYVNKETPNVKKIIDSVDEIWTVSEFIKQRVEEVNYRGIPTKVLYNGVDFSNFAKNLTKEEELKIKKEYNIKDELIFIYTGRIMPEKGVKELIEAFNVVNQKYPSLKLLIVGGTKSMRKSDAYRDNLLSISKNNKNIIFTGYIDYQDIYKFYKIADVQVVPSICNEAFGLVLLEGLPANLSVIASSSGGIPEVLKEQADYVNRDNLKEELINKMESVINRKKEQKDYSNIMEKFSIKNYCENFHNNLK